jgi:cell division protein FtsB
LSRVSRYFHSVVAPFLLACWIAWLAFGAIAGASGYRTLLRLKAETDVRRLEVAALAARREALERRAKALHPASLDPDMIEERARAVLGYAREGDLVLPREELERLLSGR